jgi:hypothetical protein
MIWKALRGIEAIDETYFLIGGNFSIRNIKLNQLEKISLYELIGDNELFKFYPELKNLYVKFKYYNIFPELNVKGRYDKESNLIILFVLKQSIFEKKEIDSILVHEIQHAIQDIDNTIEKTELFFNSKKELIFFKIISIFKIFKNDYIYFFSFIEVQAREAEKRFSDLNMIKKHYLK